MDNVKVTLITVAEAATMLGVSPQLVYKLIKGGELRAITVASSYRVYRISVVRYIKAHTVKPSTGPEASPQAVPSPCKRGPGRPRRERPPALTPSPETIRDLLDNIGREPGGPGRETAG